VIADQINGSLPRVADGVRVEAMRAADKRFFEIGDRVCLSELGESRLRKPRSKAGTVIGFGFSESRIRVLFDRLSEPTTLHHSYLRKEQQHVPANEGPPVNVKGKSPDRAP
jgi:hypothetical protein